MIPGRKPCEASSTVKDGVPGRQCWASLGRVLPALSARGTGRAGTGHCGSTNAGPQGRADGLLGFSQQRQKLAEENAEDFPLRRRRDEGFRAPHGPWEAVEIGAPRASKGSQAHREGHSPTPSPLKGKTGKMRR